MLQLKFNPVLLIFILSFSFNNIAMGHLGTLEDVASAVVFLASSKAAMITGDSLKVDGGWTAW